MVERTATALVDRIITQFNKMAFVSGPRQVGKTTLARRYQQRFPHSLYLNWDTPAHQKKIVTDPTFLEKENRAPRQPFLVVFDEIHKYARWKNYLKGLYDQYQDEFRFLVTGSGRLDLFKKGGDSLLGRYFSVPLLPLSVGELGGALTGFSAFKCGITDLPEASAERRAQYEQLFHFSGFPEPFTRGSLEFYNLWSTERTTLLVREDIRDASAIREISLLEHLAHLVPERIGNPLSINALREEVGIAFETARDWLLLLEHFFYLFRITPFTGRLARALRKEAKAYLLDWVEIADEGKRFENLVAVHLLKAVRLWQAMGEKDLSLHFLRDKEKREVDFVITERGQPVCLIECKATDTALAPSLVYFQQKLKAPIAVQLVHARGVSQKRRAQGLVQWVVSADRWLALLP
ncbi:MAG: ATP-binding protein, partial [Candidatus Binatia bacterium]